MSKINLTFLSSCPGSLGAAFLRTLRAGLEKAGGSAGRAGVAQVPALQGNAEVAFRQENLTSFLLSKILQGHLPT